MGLKKLREKIKLWASNYGDVDLERIEKWLGLSVLGLIAWVIIAIDEGLRKASLSAALFLLGGAMMFIIGGISYTIIFRDLSFLSKSWFLVLFCSVIFSGGMYLLGMFDLVKIAFILGGGLGLLIVVMYMLREFITGRK